VHVNIALIVKFMPNYFFRPAEMPEIPRRDDPAHDAFLFNQGPASGLAKIRFHDADPVFARHSGVPNVALFREQIAAFKQLLMAAAPTDEQRKDIGLLLGLGEIFTLIVYGQLVLEGVSIHGIPDDVVDQMFDVFVRDVSRYALDLHAQPSATPAQSELALKMVRRPAYDERRWAGVWKEQVFSMRDSYRMND
jgi:acyl-CoA dehydrogenase